MLFYRHGQNVKKALVCAHGSRHDERGRGSKSITRRDHKVPIQLQAQFLRDLEICGDSTPGFMLPDAESENAGKNEQRRRTPWRETDLRRAIAVAKKAGLRFYSVEIAPDGTISIIVGGASPDARKHRLKQRSGNQSKH